MKLFDISDASLTKIYGCLAKNRPTVARFARINYRISKIGESQRLFKKEAGALEILYEKEEETLTAYLTDEFSIKSHDQMYVYQSITAKLRIIIRRTLKKCASISTFVLDGFVITEEILSLIRELLTPFAFSSRLQKFTLRECDLDCTENQLFQTMSCLNVRCLSLIHVNISCIKIASMHISLVPAGIDLFSDYTYESDIDDQLLTNWLYQMPSGVDVANFKTNITLNGVLTFIKKLSVKLLCKSAGVERRSIYLGKVKTEDDYEKELTLFIRNPSIKWNLYNDINARGYRVNIDENVDVAFDIAIVNYPRITKQQTGDRISSLRAKTMEKRRMNPAYEIYDDEFLYSELIELLGTIYPDWTDLLDEIEALTTMQINHWDEEEDNDLID